MIFVLVYHRNQVPNHKNAYVKGLTKDYGL